MDAENTINNESMRMDHSHAARIQACSRYLAGSLSNEESKEFEEHFFSCQECAEDVRLGEIFADSLRSVFSKESRRDTVQGIPVPLAGPTWLERFRMSFALPVAATACGLLCLVLYQNTLQIPGLRNEVQSLSEPQTVPAVALKLTRGIEALQLPKSAYWMPYFFLGKSGQFSSFLCDIEKKNGPKLKTVPLSVPAPGQPFAILLRRSEYPSGAYVFKVRGSGDSKVLAIYTVELKD